MPKNNKPELQSGDKFNRLTRLVSYAATNLRTLMTSTNIKERLPALALRLVWRWFTQPEWRVHFVDGFRDVAAWTRSGAIAKAERLEKAQAYGCEGPIYPTEICQKINSHLEK